MLLEQGVKFQSVSRHVYVDDLLIFPTWLAQGQVRFDEQLVIGLEETLDSTVPLERNTPEIMFAPGQVLNTGWYGRLKHTIPGWYTAPTSLINLRRNPQTLSFLTREHLKKRVLNVLEYDLAQAIPFKTDRTWRTLEGFPVICELLLLAGKGYGASTLEIEEVVRHADIIKGWRQR